MLEAVEGELCLPEVIRCVLLSMLEGVEIKLCLLEMLDVLDIPDALGMLDVRNVMRCMAKWILLSLTFCFPCSPACHDIRGTDANLSDRVPRQGQLILAECPQFWPLFHG